MAAALAVCAVYGWATAPTKPAPALDRAVVVSAWAEAHRDLCGPEGCIRSVLVSAQQRGSDWCFTSTNRIGERLDGTDVTGVRWTGEAGPETWCYSPQATEAGGIYWGEGWRA